MSKVYLKRDLVEIPDVGPVRIRAVTGLEAVAFGEENESLTMASEKYRSLCDFLGRAIEEPDDVTVSDLSGDAVLALQKAVFSLSKIDAPALEDIPEGQEYVSHVEDLAEGFTGTPEGDDSTSD